jgi:hypothetical protein
MQPSCPMETIPLDDNEESHLNALPWPCHAALIHTSPTVPLPCSDCAMSFMEVHVVTGKI